MRVFLLVRILFLGWFVISVWLFYLETCFLFHPAHASPKFNIYFYSDLLKEEVFGYVVGFKEM